MEVKEKSRKRELIKSIAIVFLVILLILTFFSNTIMNRSLAEVATKSITSATINTRIRGSGTVEANENYEVVMQQTREVRSICVREGDYVSQGDLLFVLGDVESAELRSAQEQLESLNMQYEQRLLNLAREHASEDRAIQNLREELEEAVRQRDENAVTDAELSNVEGQLAAARGDLARTEQILKQLNAALSEDESYADAQAAVTKLTGEVESARALVEEYERQLEDLGGSGDDLDQRIAEAQKAANAAEEALDSAWTVYKEDYLALVKEVTEDNSSAESAFRGVSASRSFSITTLQETYIEAYLARNSESDYAGAYRVLMEKYRDLQSKQETLDQLMDDSNESWYDESSQRAALKEKLRQAEWDLAEAEQQLLEAKRDLTAAETANKSVRTQISNMEATQLQQAETVEELTEQVAELKEKKQRYDQAVELIRQTERSIEDALTGKDIDQQLEDLDLQSLRKQIEKAQELVEKYTQESVDTEVRANVSGRIAEIFVSAGKEASAGMTMATIELVDRGYLLKIPVTNEQSRQVRVGDIADVTNYYWGGEIEAVLESITPDPSNPGRGKLLVFRVSGEVDAGVNLTLSIGQRSAYYDTVVPKSALRQDANGYFVLVITVKSSPLSNRYIATRVDVQVLAEDDTNAAVSGLSAGDFVITTSNRPVESGHQVRMVENP